MKRNNGTVGTLLYIQGPWGGLIQNTLYPGPGLGGSRHWKARTEVTISLLEISSIFAYSATNVDNQAHAFGEHPEVSSSSI